MGEVAIMKCPTVAMSILEKTKIKTKGHLRKWRCDELCTLAACVATLLTLALNESHLISSLLFPCFTLRIACLNSSSYERITSSKSR